jgi:hypothetical protein
MAKTKPTTASKPRPEGELRQSQMITTYGPGALVDLVDDAILIPGLEYWAYGNAAGYEVPAPELAASLRRRGLKLSTTMPFRMPPVSRDDEQHVGCGIRAVEFPSWFLCPTPSCQRLIHKRDTELKKGQRRHRCPATETPRTLIPVRFALACVNGHLDDFPWNWFVHRDERCDAPELRLKDSGSGDLNDVVIDCITCGLERSMGQARSEESLPKCHGHRPWLGAYVGDPNVIEGCDERQRLLIRTASGGYSSQVESALTIPRTSAVPEAIREFLLRHDERELVTLTSAAELPMARKFIAVLANAPAAIAKLSDAELWLHISTFRAETQVSDDDPPPVRETEYATMTQAPIQKGDPLYASANKNDFVALRPPRSECPLPKGVADLVLVERLREVRVLTGFTRIESSSPNIYGEFDLVTRRAALSLSADWLPASEIRGEGFLVVLDLDALKDWATRPAVVAREQQLRAGWESRGEPGGQFLGVRFYLLHTLAHLLITQVSLECGYAASAIRERIYCDPPGLAHAREMAGVLLSTGSTGSEGTLGGLVQQGRRIRHHLEEALRRAKLCSHDPVCGRQQPQAGAPGRALLGSACHGCLFIAECSCERSNQYLDRALVVPTMGLEHAEELAFFPAPAL